MSPTSPRCKYRALRASVAPVAPFPLPSEATCQIPACIHPLRQVAPWSSRRSLQAALKPKPGWDERMHATALLLPPYRRGSLGGCNRHTIPRGGGWPTDSKAGEATRCRRARTSCQRRTCGHLRFVIGQCAAGRSPTCKPRMREGASWPLAAEGGRGLPTCRLVQGLPAEEIVWGRAAAGTYPLFVFCSVVWSVMSGWGGTHTLWALWYCVCRSGQNSIRLCVPWICMIPISNRMSLSICSANSLCTRKINHLQARWATD